MADRLPGISSKPCPVCSVRYTTAEGLASHITTHCGMVFYHFIIFLSFTISLLSILDDKENFMFIYFLDDISLALFFNCVAYLFNPVFFKIGITFVIG